MNYSVFIEKKVRKEAANIPAKSRSLIDEMILSLATNPRPTHAKKLTDKEGYRVRRGNYRILYTIDDHHKTVIIYRIKIKGKTTYR